MLPRNLVIVVLACAATSGAPPSALAQGSCGWSALGPGVVAYPGWGFGVEALAVFDDGSGPALFAGGDLITDGGQSVNAIARWNGTTWAPVGEGVQAGLQGLGRVQALEVFDDGTGPALYAGGKFTAAGGVPASGIARWDGIGWSALGLGVSYPPTLTYEWVQALAVFDDGSGSALYAGGPFDTAGRQPASRIAKWDGSAWSSLGSGLTGGPGIPAVSSLAVFDAGNGPALHVGGSTLATAGSTPVSNIASWSCGSTIAVSTTQAAPGAPAFINNTNLTPGSEYYNIFSLDLCPGGAGTGSYLGLCATTLPNVQFILLQAGLPPETPPFHFTAPASYLNWGPFLVGPVTLDALCFDFTGGVLGPVSPVARTTIQ